MLWYKSAEKTSDPDWKDRMDASTCSMIECIVLESRKMSWTKLIYRGTSYPNKASAAPIANMCN